ncbi:acyl-CoA N-acyltransferase [Xylariales sp. PMI_506]|nr:acyl-CoA N-acyltransferase [Xylariales sp. PMI_506]
MALPFLRPASLPPAFTVSRCTPADIPQMVSVYIAAFTQTTRFTYWWPESHEVMRAWTETRFRLRFRDPGDQQFKVVDESQSQGQGGRLVAFARWQVPQDQGEGGRHEALRRALAPGFRTYEYGEGEGEGEGEGGAAFAGSETQWMDRPPAGCREDLYDEFFAGIRGMSQKWEAKKMLELSLLCADPAYHGRGVGSALISSILDVADANGVTTYLEGLENAVPVYKHYGFKTVDRLEYDLAKAGKKGKAVVEVMLREPKGAKEPA